MDFRSNNPQRTLLKGFFLAAVMAAGLSVPAQAAPGRTVDTYRGVPVYKALSRRSRAGKHFSSDRYYYGQKWQCVEFVKRFYYIAKEHPMPNIWGHAKEFYNHRVPHGKVNRRRGLVQYRNGGDMMPSPDDIIVWNSRKFGHVAIISKVSYDEIEVVQQNTRRPRDKFKLIEKNGRYYIKANGRYPKPLGWLRLPRREFEYVDDTKIAEVMGRDGYQEYTVYKTRTIDQDQQQVKENAAQIEVADIKNDPDAHVFAANASPLIDVATMSASSAPRQVSPVVRVPRANKQVSLVTQDGKSVETAAAQVKMIKPAAAPVVATVAKPEVKAAAKAEAKAEAVVQKMAATDKSNDQPEVAAPTTAVATNSNDVVIEDLTEGLKPVVEPVQALVDEAQAETTVAASPEKAMDATVVEPMAEVVEMAVVEPVAEPTIEIALTAPVVEQAPLNEQYLATDPAMARFRMKKQPAKNQVPAFKPGLYDANKTVDVVNAEMQGVVVEQDDAISNAKTKMVDGIVLEDKTSPIKRIVIAPHHARDGAFPSLRQVRAVAKKLTHR